MAETCLGDSTCEHFSGERFGTFAVIQHGDNPEHQRTFTAGEYPEGLCPEGHDVSLERWLHGVMAAVGCEPADA